MRKNQMRWADFLFASALLLGAWVRFLPTLDTGLPINDGGMFYVMISDLRASHFLLPAFTSYNHLNIPFAYPPLSFYVAGLISLTGISTLEILRWLPPLVSTLSIAAFYWMAGRMLNSRSKAALASMVYALMPRLFSWYVMGGGLSRSFGLLFLLLTCASAWTLFTKPGPQSVLWTALFGAGAILSHPETGLHAAAGCALIWLFKGRSARGARDALLVALGVIGLASPWWGTVLFQHGLGPFEAALSTGGHTALFWLPWITFDFAEERFATLLTVLGLIGFAVQCVRRDWFLPLWVLLPFVVEPRSATAIAAIPLAALGGIGLSDLVIPGLAALEPGKGAQTQGWPENLLQGRAAKIVLGYTLLFALTGAIIYDYSLSNYVVSGDDRTAMAWIADETPANSRFIVLTGRPDPLEDPLTEWFPADARRTSQNTVQGREWLLGKGFMTFLASLDQLRSCLNEAPSCVEDWAGSNHLDYDYLYIERSSRTDQEPGLLLYLLKQSPGYQLVFENPGAVIFARR
ncbi:MAG TPA: glycosyltransferase family 39 protein [Anaerolineales bacterium]|nr:glycosyltransferase family 39 protein [Anaerolineales bacterium]